MTDVVRLSLDVSAVPADPVGAGRYTIHLAEALARRDDIVLRLWARRGDAHRWRAIARSGRAPAAREGPGTVGSVRAVAPTRRPLRLAWEQARLPALVKATADPTTRCRRGPACPR
jgi:hypothetical protein